MITRLVMATTMVLLVAGCARSDAPAPAALSPAERAPVAGIGPVNKPAAPVVMPKEPEVGAPLSPMTYDPKGRRDPFIPILLPPEKKTTLNLGPVKLVGIIRGQPGLMALVETPDGLGYILKVGDVLGDGRVTEIAPRSITFTASGRPGQLAATQTLRLPVD